MSKYIVLIFFITKTFGDYLSFPKDFKFGTATASYQVEGGWNASGKGENIWDVLTHEHSNWITDRSTGDIACDSYNLWKEDVELLKQLGGHYYRFSLSWSRLLPNGFSNKINSDGVRYYNDLIDELIKNNIEPLVTLYHWDLPQPLQEIGGWPNLILAKHFEQYANVAFELFGDRVKHWVTFNEPIEVCSSGYGLRENAPGYVLSGIADYLCGKTLLLAHAKAYHLYDKFYRPQQNGSVGIVANTIWAEPKTNTSEDLQAAERTMQMTFGWWMHPIYSKAGDYPQIMKDQIARNSESENFSSSRLPELTPWEVDFIRGTFDFFGLNHYTTRIVSNFNYPLSEPTSFAKDVSVCEEVDPRWKKSAANWLQTVPWGLHKLLKWVKNEYDNPLVFITENGFADNGELNDSGRIEYYQGYLNSVLRAIHEDGCNVQRYTAWSLLDNMEWLDGYTLKFGLYHVDFNDPKRVRTPKASVNFYKTVIKTRRVPSIGELRVQIV